VDFNSSPGVFYLRPWASLGAFFIHAERRVYEIETDHCTNALGRTRPGKAVLVFRFNDNDRAIAVLKAHAAALVDSDALNRLHAAA